MCTVCCSAMKLLQQLIGIILMLTFSSIYATIRSVISLGYGLALCQVAGYQQRPLAADNETTFRYGG